MGWNINNLKVNNKNTTTENENENPNMRGRPAGSKKTLKIQPKYLKYKFLTIFKLIC